MTDPDTTNRRSIYRNQQKLQNPAVYGYHR